MLCNRFLTSFFPNAINYIFVVVVVVMTSPSGGAYIRVGQMPRRDEEFHQIATVLEHICDANGVTKVPLAFCWPF